MWGAIIGDLAGSYYEMHNIKTKKFKFLEKTKCSFTDDTVMTLAVAKSLLECQKDFCDLKEILINNMVYIGKKYSQCGFGGNFFKWIMTDEHNPYNSFGNGAAMRVGCCGIVANSLDEAKLLSKITTEISHNHPEGIKAAEAVAVAIYLAKIGKSKEEIKKYVLENYYNINFTLDEIRDEYSFDVTCQGSVPQALEAFFESTSFEDAIRNSISIGGDSDTIAAICGSIAGVYYNVPIKFRNKALTFFDSVLDKELVDIIFNFERNYYTKNLCSIKLKNNKKSK